MSKPQPPMAPPERTSQCSQSMPPASSATNSSECRHPRSASIPTPERAHTAPPLSQSTPIKIRLSSTTLFSSSQKFRNKSYTTMANEMKHFIVGPMPPQAFLDAFFPTDKLPDLGTVSSFKDNHYENTVTVTHECQAYLPFIKSSRDFLPHFQIFNSYASEDRNPNINFPTRIKPDVSVYHTDACPPSPTDSSLIEIAIEFKWNQNDDPFCDDPKVKRLEDGTEKAKSFIHNSKLANDTLGQISTYAAAQLGSQFRTHAYSILILKNLARILRWDRSGAIVTAAFDYNKYPLLAEFFRRYSRAPRDMRGIDQSVSDPTAEDAVAARKALGLSDEVPLFKLEIPITGGSSRYFITTPPQAIFYAPPGRATRGFHAYDIFRKTQCFLKDTWRVNIIDIQAEGLTYKMLEGRVRNIPKCVAFGDISTMTYHATKTCDYSSQDWTLPTSGRLIPHRHYRLALDVIGRSLMSFTSSYEMVKAVRDAIIAHKDALHAKVLHRDLSPGNIIIDPNGNGVLIDWDLSRPLLDFDQPNLPRRATRTGTWQFMSGKLISMKDHVHDFTDDLESTIYILLWVALMYSKCSDRTKIAGFLKTVLDPQPDDDSTYTSKPEFLRGGQFLDDVKFVDRPCLDKLLRQLTKLFACRYLPQPSDEQRGQEATMRKYCDQSPELRSIYDNLFAVLYDRQIDLLKDHEEIIRYFEEALVDRSRWPAEDGAEKQEILDSSHSLVPQRVRKTNFSTTHFGWVKIDNDIRDLNSEAKDDM